MVNLLRIQLIADIKLIMETFRRESMDEKFEIYKNKVLEQKQYFLNYYSHLLERAPSLKTLFNLCFDNLKSKFICYAEYLKNAISMIKAQMLSLVDRNADYISNISNISNAVDHIIGYANMYIDDSQKYYDLCIKFNEKMIQLMAFPKHFWELFNDNFANGNGPASSNIDLTKYKLVTRNVRGCEISSECSECIASWIMANSQGHTIVVHVSLDEFKYNYNNFIAYEEL